MRVKWAGADWALSNAEIARVVGCTPRSVGVARRKFGAPPSPIRGHEKLGIDWDTADLGAKPDRDVAAALGVPVHAVGEARRARGIAALDPRMARRRSDAEWIAAGIGVLSDAEVARNLRVSRRCVTRVRTAMGIQPSGAVGSDTRRADIDWESVGLGIVSDERIAIDLGVPPTAVRSQRVRRGIPTATATRSSEAVDWESLDWASLSDRAISSMVSRDSRMVRDMREKLGKPRPPYAKRRRKQPEGAP